ncbi:MAG: hypothetical protein ABW252_06060 [Polyangiales bacterium]
MLRFHAPSVLAWICLLGCSASRDERLEGECITDNECGAAGRCVAEHCVDRSAMFAVSGAVRGAPASIAISASAGPGCLDQRCAVPLGESATLTAPEVAGHRFRGWSGHAQCASLEHQVRVGDVREDVACTADYAARLRVSGVSEGAAAAITASADDGFARCEGSACEVDVGDTVSLLAPSVPGFRLRGWGGDGCIESGGARAVAPEVTASRTCVAYYVAGVSVSGTVVNADAEVVAESPSAGASCQRGACAIDAGGAVVLRAPTLPSRTFEGWSGDEGCRGSEPTLIVRDVVSSKSCRATFAPRLRVSGRVVPPDAGRVVATASSRTAACKDASCEVDVGTGVSLVASAGDRYRFTGWSGGAECMGATNRLDVLAPRASLACTANFARRPHTVTLVARGGGGAEASVNGVPCPNNVCSVAPGGSVAFRAVTRGEQLFQGFACSPTAPTVTGPLAATLANVQADHTCVANAVDRALVTFDRGPSSCGTVQASVSPASGASECGPDACRVRAGSVLILRAVPGDLCQFDGWSCTGGSFLVKGETLELQSNPAAPPVRCSAKFYTVVI